MKNISILKVLKVIRIIGLVLVIFNLSFGKRFGQSGAIISMSIISLLCVGMLVMIFGFSKKLEQEKIEREEQRSNRKETV